MTIGYIDRKVVKAMPLLVALSLVIVSFASSLHAAGAPPSTVRLTPSPTSTLADGSSKITVQVYSFFYKCNSGNYVNSIDECDTVKQEGYSGETVTWANEETNLSADSPLKLSAASITTDGSGLASFTVTSSKFGNFNIYAKTSSGYTVGQAAVTFTDPSPPPPPAPDPIPVAIVPDPPEAPEAILVDSEGKEIVKEATDVEPITFDGGESVTISGTTVPNGKVSLFIFSEPQEASVTADDKGVWTYVIEGLEPGEHKVEAEVTDPETEKTSERIEILAFSVAQVETVEIQETAVVETVAEEESSSTTLLAAIGGSIVLAGAGGGYWWFKGKKSKTPTGTDVSGDNKEDVPDVANESSDVKISENPTETEKVSEQKPEPKDQ